jgi:hypothetical protein
LRFLPVVVVGGGLVTVVGVEPDEVDPAGAEAAVVGAGVVVV